MARRHNWDGEIDGLPAEILSCNVKEIPRSTLKDIANRLNADSISAGNWESLAEKLGFTQNLVLDNLTQQAKVQNTYPGLLMLQEWSRRSGSTAHVLLHALREIQREDAVGVLVNKLFELHTMQLLVNVQDGEGPPKFLRVPTQKSAPLHASLDNTLQKPPYWYDIVGPRYDINWNTPSGVLQGSQLTLRLRVEPSENSMSQIYGTSARLCQPPPNHPLAMNIPPEQHLAFQEGNGTSLLNNLSNSQLSRCRRDGKLAQSSPPHCFPPQTPAISGPVPLQQQNHDIAVYDFEPLTNIGPPRSKCPQQFPNFDTLMSSSPGSFLSNAPPVSVSSLLNSTDNMEYHPSSCTGLKEPVVPLAGTEHDETLLKENVKSVHEKMNIVAVDKAKCPDEDTNAKAVEHDEMALMESVPFTDSSRSSPTASSFMHPVYVSLDRAIQFCNNPTSPPSLGSNSSSISSTGGSDVRPQFVLELQSADPNYIAAQQQDISPDEFRRMVNTGEYVPVKFIEEQSQNFEKTQLSDMNEEENMQTECSDLLPTAGMNDVEENGVHEESAAASTYSNMDSSKPKPCTYTMYRPGVVNSQEQADFQPRPLPHSVSLDNNHGYMDMRGSQMSAAHQHHTPASSAMMAGIHSCMSVDSYMNTQMPDFNLHNVSASHLMDSTSRNMSIPNLNHLLHSRSRNPLSVGGDMLQPRDRRPLTQDHELLLDDPDPEYTYIDAASVSQPADISRRSSEGGLSMAGGKYRSTDRPGMCRDSDSVRRNSDVKLDHRGSVCQAELEQVPGWNANITERTVEHEMSRYINDDGNFIVWRYTVGGKYVISVSHLRSLRHYAVYESEREGKVYYYIFPKGARFTSLTALILHCQEHGVAEPTKTFKTPDGKQAHRSSGSSGRFSHVRLRFPIPARRN